MRYRLRHPLLALDLIYEHVAADMMILHSLMRGSEQSYAGGPTNWWIPNRACIEAMLRSAGFRISSLAGGAVYVCQRRS